MNPIRLPTVVFGTLFNWSSTALVSGFSRNFDEPRRGLQETLGSQVVLGNRERLLGELGPHPGNQGFGPADGVRRDLAVLVFLAASLP